MSEIHGPGDEGAAALAVAPAPAPGTAADDPAPQEVPAWEAAAIRLSTLLAVWLGY